MSSMAHIVLWDMENIKCSKKRIDFDLQRKLIERTRSTNVFNVCFIGDFGDNRGFIDYLKSSGVTVITKKPKKSGPGGHKEADMDANIVHYIYTFAKNFDEIVYVGGDGDMLDALNSAEREGTLVSVYSLKSRLSKALKKFQWEYITGEKRA